MSLTFTNVGTAPVTGITHLTLDTPPSGLTISPGSVYIQRGAFAVQWSLSAAVSPDGHHVDAWFTGNVAVGAYIGIRASAWAGAAGPSATITGTVANAGDVNPANNLTSVDAVTGSTVPPTSPPAPPTVTSVSPTGGPSTGGTSVLLTGTNLTQGFVTMGDRLATGVVCTDSTCTATTPIGTGSADVRVTTPGGTAVAADQFAYVGDLPTPPPPTVTIVTPPVGAAEGGTAITLNGTNLAGGTVTFGSVPASNVSCADTWCTATSPAGIGVVDVQVTTAGGVSATSTADRFWYRESSPPSISGISPASGPTTGGTAVTITGAHLAGGFVRFGSTPALDGPCATATVCTATSPAGRGTVDIQVTTPGGISATGPADRFTYQASAPSPSPTPTPTPTPTATPTRTPSPSPTPSPTSMPTPPPTGGNLVPNPGFEAPGLPTDRWGSTLAPSSAVIHSGSYALAQTTSSTSGGWDLAADSTWYAPVTPGKSYTATIWARATGAVNVRAYIDLLSKSGGYLGSASSARVTLAANTWTKLTVTFIPTSRQPIAVFEPNFSGATKGTVLYWDDMSILPAS